MARIILVTGRGGAGKTTVAASTGVAASRRGARTLVLSFDLSRSLSGAFGLEDPMFSGARGLPVRINDHLHIQELDVQEELKHRWSEGHGALATLLGGGLEGVTAEEVAIAPGMDELITLLRLSEYVREKRYDVIIVDGPSTGGALRFVSGAAAMGWFARKQSGSEQRARSSRGAGVAPEARDRLAAVDELLRNPEVTTLRLVTTADNQSVQETQRAYTYFSLLGISTDCLVINRLAPGGEGAAGAQAHAQQPHVEMLQGLFDQIPVMKIPLHSAEVVGEDALEACSGFLYKGEDPARLMATHPSLGVSKEAVEVYRLEVKLPFVAKDEIELSRREDELVLRVGAVRRNILLPRMIAHLPTAGARMEGDRLIVSFRKERGG